MKMKTRLLISILSAYCVWVSAQQNVGIGTTSPQASSILDLTSTDKGMLAPRMTAAQRLAIPTPAIGLLVYQTDLVASPPSTPGFYVFEASLFGGAWKRIARLDEVPTVPPSTWTSAGSDQYNANAGAVGIGTAGAPNSSAKFEISSTTKGFLFPRMTYTERTLISTPATGLLVYQTNSGGAPIQPTGVYFYDGALWKRIASAEEIGGNGSGSWTVIGNDQYSNLSGNVGIGTSTPTSKFHLVGNLLTENGSITINNPTAILQLQSAGVNKGYVQLSGNNLRLGTNSGNGSGQVIFRMDGDEKMIIDTFGRVGIGTTSPDLRLHVYNGSIKVEYPGVNSFNNEPYTPLVNFEISDENNKSGGLNFSNAGASLAKVYYVHKTTLPDYLRFGISDLDALDLLINDEGKVGINLLSSSTIPMGQFHVRGASGVDDIVLQKANLGGSPIIQFYNTLSGGGDKKAFIQMDSDNLRLGTNSGNATGKFIIRNNGGDRVVVDGSGNMGIGTTSPLAKLDVAGRIRVVQAGEAIALDGNDPLLSFWRNGAFHSWIGQYANEMYIASNDKLHIDADQIAIGTVQSTANAYKLTVTGKIICEELKVELTANWPDYVFSDQYHLMPLNQLKTFISTNNHLPNIPKAADIEKDGLEVGEMNRKLLEKVEELTLYIIQQQEQIDDLKRMVTGEK